MSTVKRKSFILDSEEGLAVETSLRDMVTSPIYNTETSYSADSETYPDGIIPFIDKHLKYLRTHPTTDPQQYLSNLRLMTRIR